MNKKQKSLTNKGFSLVELIIVIAIMAVLVGVLAPQFIKYVEQSRRSKDIQAAANLQTAYLTDIADNQITGDLGTSATAPVEITGNKVNDATTLERCLRPLAVHLQYLEQLQVLLSFMYLQMFQKELLRYLLEMMMQVHYMI